MSLDGAAIAQIQSLGQLVVSARYAVIIGISMSLSDILHTLPREVKFYWSGRWTATRVLYFVIRYMTCIIQAVNVAAFFNPPSDSFCTIYPNIQEILDLIQIWAVQSVLIIRMHAVYYNRHLLYGLIVLLAAASAAEASVGLVGITRAEWTSEPIPGVFYCSPIANYEFLQNTNWLTWVPSLVFDSILVALALYKLYTFRQLSKTEVFRKGIISTLLHDSVFYFATLLIIAIVYMIVAKVQAENGEIASSVLFPLISAFGCRLLFHLRQREEDAEEELEQPTPIEFEVFTQRTSGTRKSKHMSISLNPETKDDL